MRLKELVLENFRGYRDRTRISFEDDLTAITGRNDVGKSTILEALAIFFNDKSVKMDAGDRNVFSDESEVAISCIFDELPNNIVVDENYQTNFGKEYLLNINNDIEIKTIYKVQKTVSSPSIFLVCRHPVIEGVASLHSLKLADVKKLGKELGIEERVEDKRIASLWRQAIWDSLAPARLSTSQIEIGSLEKDSKAIYKKLESKLPTFALFKSDRESSDSDPEAKNPMQIAVEQAKRELQSEIDELQKKIEQSVIEVANRTKEKIKEMDPALASELHPKFKEKPKWTFNFTLDGEGGVPINKRGSGIRRLILLNFFRAEAEKKQIENSAPRVIYAIEEPETSQHPNYQVMLIEALISLSLRKECQILLTTHVPALAGLLPVESIRFIEKLESGLPSIESGEEVLDKVATSLGVLPESEIAQANAVLLVEGHSDVTFINHSSKCLSDSGDIENSLMDLGIAPIPIGGCGNLKHWVSKRLIEQLGLNWGVLMDSDLGDPIQNPRNVAKVEELRADGKIAILTRKREPENYLDPELFKDSHNIEIEYTDTCDAKKLIASALTIRKDDVLEKFWPRMSADQIKECSKYNLEGSTKNEITEILQEVSRLVEG